MTVFDALKLIGGLCLFLFGMNAEPVINFVAFLQK